MYNNSISPSAVGGDQDQQKAFNKIKLGTGEVHFLAYLLPKPLHYMMLLHKRPRALDEYTGAPGVSSSLFLHVYIMKSFLKIDRRLFVKGLNIIILRTSGLIFLIFI